MGDDAVFHGVRGEPLRESYRTTQCLEKLDAGWDFASDLADTSLDDRLEGSSLEAWVELRTALESTEACPWFGQHCDARDLQGGVVPPETLARIVGRLRETSALITLGAALEADDLPNGFAELHAFLGRAADAGAWVVWNSR